MKQKKRMLKSLCLPCAAFMLTGLLASCGDTRPEELLQLAENRIYADYDPVDELSIVFSDTLTDRKEPDDILEWIPTQDETNEKNFTDGPDSFRMRVYGSMDIYPTVGAAKAGSTLKDGTVVILTELENSTQWVEISDANGKKLGYAKDGFMHAIDQDCTVYAELPIEYGKAKTNEDTYVNAYSHLVDVRKYFRTYETTEEAYGGLDLKNIDIIISMKLSTNETTIKEPFYNRNLCMLQYDILPMLKEAIELFRKDGYTVIIYDAYRPTSVQQRWFDVVRVHKWVADPSRGMGGVHDRGTAIDMSLIDKDGNLLEMPTPMHTFTEASSRLSPDMTETARANMDYMKEIMVSCGFTYINSEWWHFQDVNTKYYLPTDHPIDSIPMLVSEK